MDALNDLFNKNFDDQNPEAVAVEIEEIDRKSRAFSYNFAAMQRNKSMAVTGMRLSNPDAQSDFGAGSQLRQASVCAANKNTF